MTKIFGYDWEDIKRAQQRKGSLAPAMPKTTHDERAARICRDVERFKIDVHCDVKNSYAIALPEGYVLEGDTWRFKG